MPCVLGPQPPRAWTSKSNKGREEKCLTWFTVWPTCQFALADKANMVVYSMGFRQMQLWLEAVESIYSTNTWVKVFLWKQFKVYQNEMLRLGNLSFLSNLSSLYIFNEVLNLCLINAWSLRPITVSTGSLTSCVCTPACFTERLPESRMITNWNDHHSKNNKEETCSRRGHFYQTCF